MNQKKVFIAQNKVSETLLIPLYARAREQHQVPPLLIDESAARLVQNIDYDFQKFELAPMSMVGVVIRASYFDAIVRQFIHQHEKPIVIHLGYGLDTRCQRLGKDAEKAHFYHIDIKEVIELRESLISSLANETLIASSMFDSAWMEDLAEKHPQAMIAFVIEGVLMYFKHSRNKQLFADLATWFPGAEIHFDVISSWLSHHTYLHDAVRLTGADFKFGLDSDKHIERWHPRLAYQTSFDLMGFDGWQRIGLPYFAAQVPPLKAVARVVAYLIK